MKLDVTGVSIFKNETFPLGGIIINWSGDPGFGQYTLLLKEDGTFHGESECMDRGEDKEFIRALFAKIADKMTVVE